MEEIKKQNINIEKTVINKTFKEKIKKDVECEIKYLKERHVYHINADKVGMGGFSKRLARRNFSLLKSSFIKDKK